jgi:hypothetical protein
MSSDIVALPTTDVEALKQRLDARGGKNNNTTVASHSTTTNDGRGPPPWPTYVNPSPGHIAMYPGLAPTGQ